MAARQTWQWLLPLVALGLAAGLVFLGLYFFDWYHWSPAPGSMQDLGALGRTPFEQLFTYDPDTAQNALGNLAQVIAAVLGIVITVVSIVVQLASTRYTPRVADMFFRDRTNIAVLGFFIVAAIDAVWVSLSVKRHFVPSASITAALILVTTSVLLMIPYFAYVFAFLDPQRIIARIQRQALEASLDDGREAALHRRQERVVRSIEQLTDVAMNALAQKDKLIAQGAVDALKELGTQYLPRKAAIEQRGWFGLSHWLRRNPDFVSLSAESHEAITAERSWLEWKVLRQYQAIFHAALGTMSDMAHLVAIDTRYIGEAALGSDDIGVVRLVFKFFNTYLRAALNERQVRVAYNVLHQYRLLGERMIEAARDELAVEVAGHLRYYGQLGNQSGLAFVAETAAFDLGTLCERAFTGRVACHERILEILLELDHRPETEAQEQVLRGVRKAQAKLATFYMVAGEERWARRIAQDMADEPSPRLRVIRDELGRAASREFWEVVDRGVNFDFLDAERKQKLGEFFSWFPALQAKTVPPVSATE